MLVFGHAGITLGAAAALAVASRGRHTSQAAALDRSLSNGASWVTLLGRCIDVRVLVIGSLLPDIIDKPVGQLFFRETFSEGRIFSHTLLFLVLLSLIGFYLYRHYSRNWLLVLSFGTFTHLICDQMWRNPRTLFWPVLGFSFEREDLSNWALNMFKALLTSPGVYVPEMVGAVIIAWFGLTLLRRKKVLAFIRHGQVE